MKYRALAALSAIILASCGGGGGGGSSATTAPVARAAPIPVFKTSYENKNSIAFDATAVPSVRALGIPKVYSDEQDSVDRSIAFGDFFQEGKYSAFVMASRSDGTYGGSPDLPGIGYFLSQDASGKWVDRSTELFKTTADREGCITPSFAAVADFNNDGKPDIYIACTGFDFAVPGITWQQSLPDQRSYQVLYLSQPDGTYKSTKIEQSNPLYGHKAVAVDINGDGNVDIITTDFVDPNQPLGCGAPYVLLGHGDGTFTRDYTIIDADKVRQFLPTCGMFDVDVVPVGNRHDIFIGGENQVLWMKGIPGGFDPASGIVIPMPIDALTSHQYQFPLDIVHNAASDSFYMKTTQEYYPAQTGENWAVLKFDNTGKFVKAVDTWFNPSIGSAPQSVQFKPSNSNPGYLIPYTGACAADLSLGDCGRKVLME